MNIAVKVGPAGRAPGAVDYRWDPDTDILTANLRAADGPADAVGLSGSVELAGSDGSWLILDVKAGAIRSVEVAVWPEVKKLRALPPPPNVQEGAVTIPSRPSQPGIAALEVDAPLLAEADQAEKTFHFRIGGRRAHRALRLARDILLEVDDGNEITGVWLLNVPPFPAEQDDDLGPDL